VITSFGALIAFEPEKAKAALAELLERHDGDIMKAAAEIPVSRRTLDRWLTRLGLLGLPAEIRARLEVKEQVK